MSLVDKYVFWSNDQFYKYGKVVDKISDEYYLVDFEADDEFNRLDLMNLFMMTSCSECERYVQFFNNEEDMRAYVDYIETPSEPPKDKVVKLVQ